MEFIEFLLASRRIKTPEALCTFFVETMTALGYDLINFSIIRAYHFPELHEGFGKINTYPPACSNTILITIAASLIRLPSAPPACSGHSCGAIYPA